MSVKINNHSAKGPTFYWERTQRNSVKKWSPRALAGLPVARTTALGTLSKLGWTKGEWVAENSDVAAVREKGRARRSPITLQPLWPDANISSGTGGQGGRYLLCPRVPACSSWPGLKVWEEWPYVVSSEACIPIGLSLSYHYISYGSHFSYSLSRNESHKLINCSS